MEHFKSKFKCNQLSHITSEFWKILIRLNIYLLTHLFLTQSWFCLVAVKVSEDLGASRKGEQGAAEVGAAEG